MPFHPPPDLPKPFARLLPVDRGRYELERGRLAGREIHYLDHGPRDAPTVVLFHGNPTWSFIWRNVIAALPEYRCVAPDLLGLGLSDRLPAVRDHSLTAHADAMAELVEALGLTSAVLVGQDWGGPVSTSVGARVPAIVRGIVLCNTSVAVPKVPRGTWFHRLSRVPGLSDLVFRGLGFPQNLLWMVQGDRRSIRGSVAKAYRWPLRRIADRIAPLALARMVPDSIGHPSMAELGRGNAWLHAFGGPMALVWGTEDPVLGRALGRHVREFPDATVTRTRAGHFLQEEVPGAIADAIRGVWKRSGLHTGDSGGPPRAGASD